MYVYMRMGAYMYIYIYIYLYIYIHVDSSDVCNLCMDPEQCFLSKIVVEINVVQIRMETERGWTLLL